MLHFYYYLVYQSEEVTTHALGVLSSYRKITNDQVRVIRTVLSGTHEDMMSIMNNGRLDDWCNDSLKWLQDTFGKENIVSVVLHMDEHTPHLHASIVPIVTGERRKAKSKPVEEGKRTKSEINTEKLQAAKTEAKTVLVSKIGSLLGSGKLKEVEQRNRKLCELVTDREQYIDELHEKVQRMEDSHSKQLGEMQQKHQSEVANLESKHSTEVTMLNDIIRKAKRWFPMLDARLQMESLCQKIGFTVEQIGVLLTGKALNFSGSLYSEEHKRKFNVENAEIKVFSDSTKPNQLFLYINRQPIGEWLKEQWNNLRPFKI